MKICFYSAIFRGTHFKEFDKPTIFNKIKNCDYKLFTNITDYPFKTSWEIVNIDFPNISNSIIKAKKIKHQGYKYLENYDIIIWCDAYWHPKSNYKIFESIINQTLNSKSGILMSPNPYRICAYNECDDLVVGKKETKERMRKTKEYLKNNNLPKNFGLWRSTFICIDTSNKNFKKLLNHLWNLLENNKYTYRDQPLLSLSSFLTNISPQKCNFNMEDAFIMGKKGKHTYI